MSLEHYDQELYGLDQRIGRLGIACGVDMDDHDTVVALIKGNFAVCKQGHRVKREELRALLMVKYNIEARCIDSLGADQCRRIIRETDASLQRQGLKRQSR